MTIDSEYQAAWRDRQREKGLVPRVLYLSAEAREALAQQARSAGVNQHQYVDQLLTKDHQCTATT